MFVFAHPIYHYLRQSSLSPTTTLVEPGSHIRIPLSEAPHLPSTQCMPSIFAKRVHQPSFAPTIKSNVVFSQTYTAVRKLDNLSSYVGSFAYVSCSTAGGQMRRLLLVHCSYGEKIL